MSLPPSLHPPLPSPLILLRPSLLLGSPPEIQEFSLSIIILFWWLSCNKLFSLLMSLLLVSCSLNVSSESLSVLLSLLSRGDRQRKWSACIRGNRHCSTRSSGRRRCSTCSCCLRAPTVLVYHCRISLSYITAPTVLVYLYSAAAPLWNVVAALERMSRGSRTGNCAERGALAPRRAAVRGHVVEVPQETHEPLAGGPIRCGEWPRNPDAPCCCSWGTG